MTNSLHEEEDRGGRSLLEQGGRWKWSLHKGGRSLRERGINGEAEKEEDSTENEEVQSTTLTQEADKRPLDSTPNDSILSKPSFGPNQKTRPNDITEAVWKPKTKPEPNQLQRSPAKQEEDKLVKGEKEASRQFPKSESKSSCPSQGLKLSNRFKCLEA